MRSDHDWKFISDFFISSKNFSVESEELRNWILIYLKYKIFQKWLDEQFSWEIVYENILM